MSNPNRKVYGLSLGAILPALGFSRAWFCCLPIAAGALGAAMAAAGGVLTPLRPYFTVAAIALLGAAFYHTYKRRNTEGNRNMNQPAVSLLSPNALQYPLIFMWRERETDKHDSSINQCLKEEK